MLVIEEGQVQEGPITVNPMYVDDGENQDGTHWAHQSASPNNESVDAAERAA